MTTDYTPNVNLYKWKTTDTKQTTITETALNADKIDAKLNDHTAQLASNANKTYGLTSIINFWLPADLDDYTAAFNRAIQSGKKIFVDRNITCFGRVDLSLAPLNSYNIEGLNENAMITFIGAGAGFYDRYGSQDNRNFHTKSMSNLYLRGDGTNIGFEFASLQLHCYNMQFINFNRALYIHDGGYQSHFDMIKMQQNKFNIYIGDYANGMEITNINIDGQSDITGAGIYFASNTSGSSDIVIKITGLIESCKAPAIWYGAGFKGQVEVSLYLELVGDKDQNSPAIRNDSTENRVSYVNCTFPNDTTPWVTGDYQLGNDVSIRNSQIGATIKNYRTLSITDSQLGQDGCYLTENPVTFNGINPIHPVWYNGGSGGIIIQVPLSVPSITMSPYVNKKIDPWCDTEVLAAADYQTNNPVITLDTVNKLFGKNSTKIVFADGVAGSLSNNKVWCAASSNDFDPQVTLEPNQLYVWSFFAKANKVGDISIVVGDDIITANGSINLDTSWRKYVIIGHNYTDTSKLVRPYITAGTAKTGFEINVTGMVQYENLPNDLNSINEFLKGSFKY